MAEIPSNVAEFNTIAGLIFAQLYPKFPDLVNIDREAIAKAMGVTESDWGKHKLESGRSFSAALSLTTAWLEMEGYIKSAGSFPGERAILTTKGLTAMNAIPSGLKQTLGTAVVTAAAGPIDLSRVGDLVGGIFGGFTKSMGGG